MNQEKRIIVGIDPGLQGGICFLADKKPLAHYCMPTINAGNDSSKQVDSRAVMRILQKHNPDIAYVEMQFTKKGYGYQFTNGRNFGLLEAAIILSGTRLQIVPATTWKNQVLGTTKGKEPSIRYCELFNFPVPVKGKTGRGKMPHDGIADAWCIAVYGVEQERLLRLA